MCGVCAHTCISDLLCAHIHVGICMCACTHVQICTHVYVDLIFVSRVDAHKRILAPFPLSISLFPQPPFWISPSLPPFGSLTSALALGTLISPAPPPPRTHQAPLLSGHPDLGAHQPPPNMHSHAHTHTHTRTHVHTCTTTEGVDRGRAEGRHEQGLVAAQGRHQCQLP